MTIHKEGIRIILFSLLIVHLLEFLIFGYVYSFVPHFVSYLLASIPLIFFLLILQFFRIPSRKIIYKEGTVLCPADGKIVAIEEVEEAEYFKEKRIQVSIFMSPLNVHANYYPVSGKVKYVKYHPGLFLVAFHPKSSTDNERTTVVVEDHKEREVLFRQIAGAVARRICLYAEKDRTITAGSEFGFIKFGSRVDVFLPLGTEINVELDQVVKGKITKLATFAQ
tara:strand:+ start:1842 stop:2510 length:669 start_codon:yes stop_codon:yes gene_type:complete